MSNCTDQDQKNVVLEVITNRKLAEIQKSCQVLYAGQIVIKKEGGFKNLYDLPPTSMLDRLKSGLMTDFLRIRICHKGWLCQRNSGWIRTLCVLSSSNGLLLVYTKPYKGYALKLSYARELKTSAAKKELLTQEKPSEFCILKLKWDFGTLEIELSKNQIDRWRRSLINSFDAQYPCFENGHTIQPKATQLNNSSTSTDDLHLYAETVSSSTDSWASALSSQEEICTATKSSLASEYEDIPLNDADSLTSVQEVTPNREIPDDSDTTLTFNPAKMEIITMKYTSCEANIYRAVYRLETEREKISRPVPPIQISDKVRYFENLDPLMFGQIMMDKKLQLTESDSEPQSNNSSMIIHVPEIPAWKLALMKTPF